MSRNNQFNQYGYGHYLKAPKPSQRKIYDGVAARSSLFGRGQSPGIATVALAGAALLFVGVIVFSYPAKESRQQSIPIVRADLSVIKKHPVSIGGMEIPNRDSTILARNGKPTIQDDTHVIENLLAQQERAMVQAKSASVKEHAILRAMKESEGMRDDLRKQDVEVTQWIEETSKPVGQMKRDEPIIISKASDVSSGRVENLANAKQDRAHVAFKLLDPVRVDLNVLPKKVLAAQDVLKKIEGSVEASVKHAGLSAEDSMKIAYAAMKVKPARALVSVAGASKAKNTTYAQAKTSGTIDYVRGVLKKGDGMIAKELSAIEPSVGVAAPSSMHGANAFGAYFVQLASITNAGRAGSEWAKMQKKYNLLSGAKYRVQEVSLKNGTFYRIQVGPMSKVRAHDVCGALKKMNKPGGCLVVK